MSTEVVIGGRGETGSIVWTPAPGMAKSIVFVPPVTLLESRIAWRSEPGPLSAVVVTTKTPSVTTNCAWSGSAPSDWASTSAWCCRGARRRVEGHALQRRVERRERTAVRQRSGPIARAGQAGGTRERQRPGRDRKRQVPRRVERPGIGVLDRDAVARGGREDQRLAGSQANGLRGHLEAARTQGRDLGGVALGVGRRGRDDRQPGRRREGDVEVDLALARRSSPPASPGSPRPHPSPPEL